MKALTILAVAVVIAAAFILGRTTTTQPAQAAPSGRSPARRDR
jgi:hypothetical protein